MPQKEEKNPMLQLANENPLGITIKEITKPEEIRITDDKPKPFNPFKSTTTTTTTTTTTVSPSTTTTTTAETIESTTASTESANDVTATSTESSTTNINSISTTESLREVSTEGTNQVNNANESRDYMDDGIAISEDSSSAAPSTKAPVSVDEVEPELLLVNADSNSIGDDSGNKSVRQTPENSTSVEIDQSSENLFFSSTTEPGTESSTATFSDISSTENGEMFDLVSSTPKNLVVVRQGGKTESFHISGTDGLQRVEEFDVLSSTTEDTLALSSEQSVFISTGIVDGRFSEEMMSSTTAGPEEFDNVTVPLAIEILSNLGETSAENVTNSANSSLEVSTESSSEMSPSSEQIYETVYYPDTSSPSTEGPIDTVYFGSNEDVSSTTPAFDMSSSSESFISTTSAPVSVTEGRFSYEEEDITPAENPEYPPIPDDVSIHQKENGEEEKRRLPSKVLVEETPSSSTAGPELSSVLEDSSLHSKEIEEEYKHQLLSKILDEIASSTAGPCDECDIAKSAEVSTTQGPPTEDIKMSHKMDIVEHRLAPGEPNLVPEWERSTTQKPSITDENLTTLGPREITTAGPDNEINKTAIFDKVVTKTNKSEAQTLEILPNDLSSEEKYGKREPTTERSTTKGYASINDSEEGSASSAQFDSSTEDFSSPNYDAESIKLNSSGGDGDEGGARQFRFFEGLSFSNPFVNHWRNWCKENSFEC